MNHDNGLGSFGGYNDLKCLITNINLLIFYNLYKLSDTMDH